jgi:hypothetical protein
MPAPVIIVQGCKTLTHLATAVSPVQPPQAEHLMKCTRLTTNHKRALLRLRTL